MVKMVTSKGRLERTYAFPKKKSGLPKKKKGRNGIQRCQKPGTEKGVKGPIVPPSTGTSAGNWPL